MIKYFGFLFQSEIHLFLDHRKIQLTAAAKQIKSIVVVNIITDNPLSIRVFLPAFSINIKEIIVMATFIAPIPKVAD